MNVVYSISLSLNARIWSHLLSVSSTNCSTVRPRYQTQLASHGLKNDLVSLSGANFHSVPVWPTILMSPLFLCLHYSWVHTFPVCAHCFCVPIVLVSPLLLCTHSSCVHICSCFLTVPLSHCHCVPLFLFSCYCFVPSVPVFPSFFCVLNVFVPPLFLCTLFICPHCSYNYTHCTWTL